MAAFKPATSLFRLRSHWSRTCHAARHASDRAGSNDAIGEDDLYVKKTEVIRFMREVMERVGTPTGHAQMLADNLVEADYRGHFSHGLNRLQMYVKDIGSGHCDPRATPTVLKESEATAWVDGNNGLGVVVGTFAMELAMSKCRSSGVGWVCAKRSNHFGICQWYTEMAASKGLIGMAATNTSPFMCPTRSKTAVFGTNPIAVMAAGSRASDSFNLDMATTAVAVGKIEMQLRRGQPLPSAGWALDSSGNPTTDAHEAFHRGVGLFPLGGPETNSGYKGYGLAMLVELLCGVMSDSAVAHNVRKWTNHDVPANLGQFFLAVDPDRFAPGFGDRLQSLMDHIRSLPPTDPALPVLVPGDPERLSAAAVDTADSGAIKYTEDHIRSYRSLAAELGVTPMRRAERAKNAV